MFSHAYAQISAYFYCFILWYAVLYPQTLSSHKKVTVKFIISARSSKLISGDFLVKIKKFNFLHIFMGNECVTLGWEIVGGILID